MWRSKPVEEAVESLKNFLSCIMIRRTKAILNLPSREDKIMRIPFDDQEKEHYQRIERPTVDMLDQTEKERKSSGASWMTTIQQINKLRLICNLGTYVPPRRPGLIQSGNHDRLAVLGVRLSIEGETCAHCLQSIELLSSETEMNNQISPKVYYSNCDLYILQGLPQLSTLLLPHQRQMVPAKYPRKYEHLSRRSRAIHMKSSKYISSCDLQIQLELMFCKYRLLILDIKYRYGRARASGRCRF
jgi:SNF2 family DNA or RNA helicase